MSNEQNTYFLTKLLSKFLNIVIDLWIYLHSLWVFRNWSYRYKKKAYEPESEEDVKKNDKKVSLDKFLSKYTSEDNESFETIMVK